MGEKYDLVEKLRSLYFADEGLLEEAADHIEELETKLAECKKYRDAYAECDRIGTQAVRDLEAKLAECEARLEKAVEEMEKVDAYLTRLQTPNSEPLNSVNSCGNKKGRGQYTAMVRNEAREFWASLGNTLAELSSVSCANLKGQKDERKCPINHPNCEQNCGNYGCGD